MILVSDTCNHRIQVFLIDPANASTKPHFLYSFGEHLPKFKLRNLNIFFTGRMGFTKAEAEERVSKLGAHTDTSIGDNTQVMVVGSTAPLRQIEAAKKKGISVWTEEEFVKVRLFFFCLL